MYLDCEPDLKWDSCSVNSLLRPSAVHKQMLHTFVASALSFDKIQNLEQEKLFLQHSHGRTGASKKHQTSVTIYEI